MSQFSVDQPLTPPLSGVLMGAFDVLEPYKWAFDQLPLPLWLGPLNGAGWCNHALRQCLGDAVEISGSWLSYLHPEDYAAAAQRWHRAVQDGSPFTIDARLRTAAGNYRWFQWHASPTRGIEQQVLWQLVTVDVDAFYQAQAKLQQQAQVHHRMLDASVDCIKLLSPEGAVEQMNRSGCVALGLGAGATTFGMPWLSLLPKEVRANGVRALKQAQIGKPARFAGMSVTADKKIQHWDNILTPIQGDQGQTAHILCVSREVTLQRIAEQRLRQASDIDELTGLYNRRYFRVTLRRLLSRAREQGSHLGLLLIDLDYFKHINDTLGHPAGDHLLKQIAKRMRSALPRESLIARLGGDEFAIVFSNICDPAALIALAEQTCALLQQPITYAGKLVNGGMSIGAAIFPEHGTDSQALMKAADTALNDLKAGGRGGVRLYSERMQQHAEQTAAQLIRAREIVNDGSLQAFYQPKVNLQTGKLIGFEALLRWLCPTRGPQTPNTIVEAFNDYQLATQIGERMQRLVLADICRWRAAGLPLFPVSINAAPVEFLRDDYAERLLAKLAQFAVPTALIEVEITEHVLNERGSEFVARALAVLKQAGVRIALDDFGTGHSSLANLRDYPVDCLKIDCGFVWRLVDEPSIYAIVQAIAQLGPSLAIDVVAEGVETQAQREKLVAAGCTQGQGLLWGGAANAQQTAELLAAVR